MVKLAPGVRLLRSLSRAAKAQQSLAATLLGAFAPAPQKPASRRSTSRPAPREKRALEAGAPGQWLEAQFPLPPQPRDPARRELRLRCVPARDRDLLL